LQTGKLMQYVPENGMYVYFRYDANKTVMIVMNTNEKEESVKSERFNERIAGFSKATNVISGDQLSSIETVKVPAKSVWVLELKK